MRSGGRVAREGAACAPHPLAAARGTDRRGARCGRGSGRRGERYARGTGPQGERHARGEGRRSDSPDRHERSPLQSAPCAPHPLAVARGTDRRGARCGRGSGRQGDCYGRGTGRQRGCSDRHERSPLQSAPCAPHPLAVAHGTDRQGARCGRGCGRRGERYARGTGRLSARARIRADSHAISTASDSERVRPATPRVSPYRPGTTPGADPVKS